MILARFFIGDEPIEYSFNENNIQIAINDLSMMYYEKLGATPLTIFLSPDLYHEVYRQSMSIYTYASMTPELAVARFHTAVGIVEVQPVYEPKERFIYAGDQKGYQGALIDKRFEEIVLGEFE